MRICSMLVCVNIHRDYVLERSVDGEIVHCPCPADNEEDESAPNDYEVSDCL
jgi:hypothetical protein